jgi:hypothetical protein
MAPLRPAESAETALWIVEAIHGFAQDVGSVVPEGFDGYARIFHPAQRGRDPQENVTWAEIASSTGRTMHAGVQWPHVAFSREISNINELQEAPPGAPWDTPPDEGCFPKDLVDPLLQVLTANTGTADLCWFAVWEGWGDLRTDAKAAASFELPSRRYFLYQGSIEAAKETFSQAESSYESASLWWPDDKAWCVATEVDFESTYVGGSQRFIEEVLTASQLEALPVDLHQGITWDSDTINPNPLRLRQ